MSDLLVNLYNYEVRSYDEELVKHDIRIVRALSLDMHQVLKFIEQNFDINWVSECHYAFTQQPISCFIAIQNQEVVGFACFDATAKGFFGPMGVKEELRGKKVGAALLHRTMIAMKEHGYGYAIIGWAAALPFYQKEVGAIVIPNSEATNSIYKTRVHK